MLSHTKFQNVDSYLFASLTGAGHTCLQQQLTEHVQTNFASPSKYSVGKKKDKKRKAIAKLFV